MHKFVALSMSSAPQQQGIVPIELANTMHRILKNRGFIRVIKGVVDSESLRY
jgi:hypothetical protein